MQFPWRHGEPLCRLHGYYSSERGLPLVGSRAALGGVGVALCVLLHPWVVVVAVCVCVSVGWGGRPHRMSLMSAPVAGYESRARRTLLAASLTRRHAD